MCVISNILMQRLMHVFYDLVKAYVNNTPMNFKDLKSERCFTQKQKNYEYFKIKEF